MNIVETDNVALPSNREDLKKIRESIVEISNSMTRQEAERDFVNEVLKDLEEKYEIPTKYMRKVARIYHKQNFNQEYNDFESLDKIYTAVIDGTSVGED